MELKEAWPRKFVEANWIEGRAAQYYIVREGLRDEREGESLSSAQLIQECGDGIFAMPLNDRQAPVDLFLYKYEYVSRRSERRARFCSAVKPLGVSTCTI